MNTTSEIQMTAKAKPLRDTVKMYFSLLRGKQWIKNGFVFIPLLLQFRLPTLLQFKNIMVGAFLFCMISSVIYILNDLADVACDRKHPVKKYRPIAAGAISEKSAKRIDGVLALLTFGAAFLFNRLFFGVVICYFILNVAYSLKLKRYIFIDVFIISIGFILRLLAGFLILDLPLNEKSCLYFILFISFLTLFVGMGKRKGEMDVLEEESKQHRQALEFYSIELIDQLMLILTTCTIMTYVLFIMEIHIILSYITVPLLLYGIFCYQYLGKNASVLGRPDKMIFLDRPLRFSIMIWGLTFIGICIEKSF